MGSTAALSRVKGTLSYSADTGLFRKSTRLLIDHGEARGRHGPLGQPRMQRWQHGRRVSVSPTVRYGAHHFARFSTDPDHE
jgi:hypothetical protein